MEGNYFDKEYSNRFGKLIDQTFSYLHTDASIFDNDESKKQEAIVNEIWKKSQDEDDFLKMIMRESRLKQTYIYARLSMDMPGHWKRIRAMFGDKCFKTDSDCGAVAIMSRDFCSKFLITNGRGDGETRVAIFKKEDKFNTHMMNFVTTIEGAFAIMKYDCLSPAKYVGDIDRKRDLLDCVAKPILGEFMIFNYDGLVAFVRC